MNFTSALPDTNYVDLGNGGKGIATVNALVMSEAATATPAYVVKTTRALAVFTTDTSATTLTDPFTMNYTIIY